MRRKEKVCGKSLQGVLFALLFSLALASAAAAQNAGEAVPVVVTAFGTAVPEGETTHAVVVMSREEIGRLNVRFVPEVLRLVAEINVVQSGGRGKLATVFLRGGSPSETLVMIDGVRVNSTATGEFDFSGVHVEDIERIEIVKGPLSSLYGSAAMAGVINIITRKGRRGFGMDLGYLYGERDTHGPALTLSGGGESYGYRLTSTYFETSGISQLRGGGERDGYENTSVSGMFGIRLSAKSAVEITARRTEDKSDLDPLHTAGSDDPNFLRKGEHYMSALRGVYRASDTWEQALLVSTSEDELDFTDPDTAGNNASITSGMDIVEWRHNFAAPDGSTAALGAEYREERGANRGVFDETAENRAVYFATRRKAGRLTFSAGIRHDDHEFAGEKITYRVAATDAVQEGVRFWASYATGFRAPDFNELFFQGPLGSGDTGLKPEKTKSWEVGAEQDYTANSTITVAYFEQDYDDLIEWVESPPGQLKAVNVPDAEVKGFEAKIDYRASDYLTFCASYAYLDTEDKQTGGRLSRRPADRVTVSGDYSLGGLALHADYLYVGKRSDRAAGKKLLAYNVVNLSGSYGIAKHIEVFARAENVLDEDYEEAGGFGRPGASVFGGLNIKF
jgi:vitamin B12 transporter